MRKEHALVVSGDAWQKSESEYIEKKAANKIFLTRFSLQYR
jgi:hypothetical protein